MEQSIIISRPIASVFAYRCALQNVPSWRRDIVAADLDSPGPTQLGTRCRETRQGPNGAIQAWQLEVIEFEQDSVLGIVCSCGDERIDERHLFTPNDRDTRYTLCLEVTGSSVPPAAIHRKTVEALLNLKWAVEGPSVRSR